MCFSVLDSPSLSLFLSLSLSLSRQFLFLLFMNETRGVISLLFYTEKATLKQTLDGACLMAQRLASSLKKLTATLQSHPFNRKRTSWVFELPTGQPSGRALKEDVIQHIFGFLRRNVTFS